jgi:hypothetical protein
VTDLKNPKLIYLKGFLFLFLGATGSILLLLQAPSGRVAALLLISIWSFCRFYYFAFYVIQHYVDPGFRFAGLLDFFRYVRRKRHNNRASGVGVSKVEQVEGDEPERI